MKKHNIFLIFLLVLLLISPLTAKKKLKYYQVDKVKTIIGKIVSVKTEKLASAKKYAVIYLKEKTSGEIYRVEVSPRWYFHLDLIMGSRIEVTGSFSKSGSTRVIMTRTITSRGKRYHFRDKHGFPMWRGTRKQKRRVKRGRGNGIRRGGR